MFSLLTSKFSSLFSALARKGTLTESQVQEALVQIKDALISADVPYAVVEQFSREIEQEVSGQKVIGSLKPTEHLIKIVHDKIKNFLAGSGQQMPSFPIPSTFLMVGLQGSGKTTTTGKLALALAREWRDKGKPKKILLSSVDFHRPAAIDQLEMVAQQAGVSFYRSLAREPLKATQEILHYSKEQGIDFLYIDTAGRLQVDEPLLQELRSIKEILHPRATLLVLDAMTGQESLSVAQTFNEAIGFDGALLTKFDSDSRGGAAFAFAYMLKKPIWYVGMGEKLTDLEGFHPDRIANRLLGMGDLKTLLEKANTHIQQSEQASLEKSMASGRFTLQDFAQQLAMMKKMGSFMDLVRYVPGMGGAQITPEMAEKTEVELKRFQAIIGSMTPKERILPHILNGSRKNRIAKGAGVQLADVNLLLQRFEQSQQYVKLLKKFGRFPGMFK